MDAAATTPPRPKPPTLEEYFELERTSPLRHEYHGDRIVAMAGGTLNHGRIGNNVATQLNAKLGDRPCEAFNADTRISVRALGKYFFPDASAVCGPAEIDRGGGFESLCNPQVIVEVLSPTTERDDRNKKFDAYSLLPSLREYALVEQDEARVTLLRRQPGGPWIMTHVVGLDSAVRFESIDVEIAMRDIYRKVEFTMVAPPAIVALDEIPPAADAAGTDGSQSKP